MNSPHVELRILGPTDLAPAGNQTGGLVLRQPKRLALLAYLALATSDGYRRRDQIIAILWPERDQMHARTQLRKSLHILRRVIGTEAFIVRGEDEIRLNLDAVWCDALAFRRHCDAREWTDALALYRGDLLEGLYPGGVGPEFESWLDDHRTSLRELGAKAAWEQSTVADLKGDRVQAIASARRAVELSPDDEESVRRLIAVLDRHGDRAGAARIFATWQSRLRREFGAEPAPETRKLARRVLAERKGESMETPTLLHATAADLESGGNVQSIAATATSPATRLLERRRPWLSRRYALIAIGLFGAAVGSIAILRGARYDATTQPSVAVLTFRGIGDSSTRMVGESIVEEVTTALAQLPRLTVRASAESREALRASTDLRTVGRRLGVGYVVEGAVAGDQRLMRVTVRLVRVRDGVTRWARAFDVDPADIVGAQQRIASATTLGAGLLLGRDSLP